MAFTSTGLSLLLDASLGGVGPNLWSYVSGDASSLVGVTGYFVGCGAGSPHGSPAGMKVGDLVFAAQTTGGSPAGQASVHSVIKSSANTTDTNRSSTWGYDISVSTAPVSTL